MINRRAMRGAPTVSTRRPVWLSGLIHVVLLLFALFSLFPILWVVLIAIDPRNMQKPTGLPPGISFQSFWTVLTQYYQSSNYHITFWNLLGNSLFISMFTVILGVGLGASAAYAFSRFKFRIREVGLMYFLVVLMLPSVATIPVMYILLVRLHLFDNLLGLVLVYTSSALPFCIWNMKGYFDTVPKELEEAALIDGCTQHTAFARIILPLSLPGLAITALYSFMTGWTEYVLAWTFLNSPQHFTLPMTLYNMLGQYNTPWAQFAAMSLLVSVPVVVVMFTLQRWLVGGLVAGGLKG